MSNPIELLMALPEAESKPYDANVKTFSGSGPYTLGKATRPNMRFDNGHLDKFQRREPTAGDYAELLKWKAILAGAEGLCTPGNNIQKCSGELSDATVLYRHFLHGKGEPFNVDYERYLKNDPTGPNLLRRMIIEFQTHAEVIGLNRTKFSVTSVAFTCGGGSGHYGPMPESNNWRKSLGQYFFWISGNLTVAATKEGIIMFEGEMIIHVEDRYNFNPGGTDIATGIPDSHNGRFEITGLGHQFQVFGTVSRRVRWKKGEAAKISEITKLYN